MLKYTAWPHTQPLAGLSHVPGLAETQPSSQLEVERKLEKSSKSLLYNNTFMLDGPSPIVHIVALCQKAEHTLVPGKVYVVLLPGSPCPELQLFLNKMD